MKAKQQVQVSVIIPCLNCEDTIERAVNSVFQQTWQPKEVFLIADHGSKDQTLSKLKDIEARFGSSWIKVLQLGESYGPSLARNFGWDSARQLYVAFLDSDDAWHPRKVELQLKFMQDYPEVDITSHLSKWLREGENPPPLQDHYSISPITKKLMLVSNQLVTSTVMLKRNLNFRFDTAKRHSEDYLLWLQIIFNGSRGIKIDSCLAYSYKPSYGSSGLSGQLWAAELGELDTYEKLYYEKIISLPTLVALGSFSLAKFVRRVIISKLRVMR